METTESLQQGKTRRIVRIGLVLVLSLTVWLFLGILDSVQMQLQLITQSSLSNTEIWVFVFAMGADALGAIGVLGEGLWLPIRVPGVWLIIIEKLGWGGTVVLLSAMHRRKRTLVKDWRVLMAAIMMLFGIEILLDMYLVTELLPFTLVKLAPGCVNDYGMSWYVLLPGWVVISQELGVPKERRVVLVLWLILAFIWLLCLAVASPILPICRILWP